MSETSPTPPATAPASGDTLDRFFAWLRGLGIQRDRSDKWLGGVSSGLAHRLGVDPILVRAGFVVFAFLGGIGVTAYLLAWALLPDEQSQIMAERGIRHGDGWPIVLMILAALSFCGLFVNDKGPFWGPGWLIPAGIIAWVVIRRSRGQSVLPSSWQRSTSAPPTSGYGSQAGHPGPMAAMSSTVGGTTATTWAVGTDEVPTATPPTTPPPVPPTGGYVPPPPAAPARPRRRRAGGYVFLLTLGLGVAAYGLGQLLRDPVGFSGSSAALGAILALGAVGALLTVVGLSGRRGGFSTLIGLILLVGTSVGLAAPGVNVGDGVGERTWQPSASATNDDFRLGIGSGILDLSHLPTTTTTPARFDVNQGIGDLQIRIPSGMTVQVDGRLGLGDITVNGDQVFERTNTDRDNQRTHTWSNGSDPDVIVDASIGLGTITIDEGK